MRTVPFRQVFNRTARWMGFNPNKEIPPDDREAIVDRINDRVRPIWSGWPWPEWQVTEQRAFRQIWNSADQYHRDDGTGNPEEVFFKNTVSYFRVIEDLDEDPPVGTLPTDTNFWIPIEAANVGTYIAYDQRCRRSIGQVSGVFRSRPTGCGCNGSSSGLKFHPSQNGIEICGAGGPTVYIDYRMPVPRYSMEPYASGRTYNRADTVVDPVSGECYQALRTTTNPPGTTDWSWLPFLDVWAGFVINGAYADALNELNREGNAETQVLELKAIRAEERANKALESEVDALRYQGQMLEWSVCKKNGYWCESLPWSGGDVLEIDEECQAGIVFPNIPFPEPPPPNGNGGNGGNGEPVDLTDVARISLPNVFERENTFSGIRLGKIRIITDDYFVQPTDGVILADCSAGSLTITLPISAGTGHAIWLLKTDESPNEAFVQPRSGDLINDLSSITLAEPVIGIMVCDVVGHLWSMMISPFTANRLVENVFNQATTLNGLRFDNPRSVTAGVWPLESTDTVVLADASDGDVTVLLPLAEDGGFYYIRMEENSTHPVIVQCTGDDEIDGATNTTFITPGSDGFFIAAGPGRWCNPGGAAPEIEVPHTDVSWWYRPDIDTDTKLKAFPTLDNSINSRIDVIYPSGMRTYIIRPLAADPADPGHVAPNDYNATTNNIHWEQKL